MIKNNFNRLWLTKQAKDGRQISKREISEETGLSYGAVDNWAHGRITRYDEVSLVALTAYFNCDVGDLISVEHDADGDIDEGQSKTAPAVA